MHRIAILTLSIGEEFTRCMAPGLKSKDQYAQRWGHRHIVGGDRYHDPTRPVAWSKLGFWLDHLDSPDFEFLWLSDADSIITNPDVSLDALVDLVFQDPRTQGVWWVDAYGNRNSGQMLVRTRSEAVRRWITQADAQHQFTHHVWWENRALIRIWATDEQIKEVIALRTDCNLINAYLGPPPEVHWDPSCFVLHYAGYHGDRSRVYRHMTTVARPDLARD